MFWCWEWVWRPRVGRMGSRCRHRRVRRRRYRSRWCRCRQAFRPWRARDSRSGRTRSSPLHRIALSLDPGATYGEEGYELATAGPNATLKARTPAGLFYGVQTIRQLLPYWSEYRAVVFLQPKPLTLRAVHITDSPRYPWRGAMLDVARHFFGVEDVKRFIDLLALHKMNRLHLHLADDQGWRIEIKKRPDL